MKWYGWAIVIVVFGAILLFQLIPFEKEPYKTPPVDEYKPEDSTSPASNLRDLKKLDSVKK